MRYTLLSLLSLLALTACSSPYMGKELYGADEFVLDSYKIREGKFSILELEGVTYDELDEAMLKEYPDAIANGDVLQIAVYNPRRPELAATVAQIGATIGYRVIEGKIQLPDLSSIEVAGLSLAEARRALQEAYQKEVRDTEVFLSYKDRMVRKVELAGMVAVPSVPVDGKIRLYDILALARVPTDANLFRSYVSREGKLLPVDISKLLKEGDMTQNIVMRGGDKVYIADPGAASLMVMGEVAQERVLPLPSGYLSLRHALAAAGGIPYTGDKSYIQIIRGNICKPKIYTVSWEHVIHLPNESLLLMPGDIVYVAAKPITEWNRFISQLLPSFGGLEAVRSSCVNWGIFAP